MSEVDLFNKYKQLKIAKTAIQREMFCGRVTKEKAFMLSGRLKEINSEIEILRKRLGYDK